MLSQGRLLKTVAAAKILLVFSDTGGGHRSACEAIKLAITEICQKNSYTCPEILSQDIIEESNAVNRLFAHVYNNLLKNHQDWMKYYIALIEWIKPNESNLAYKISATYTKNLILDIAPTLIVSVHPMVNHFLARSLNELGLHQKIKLITVLTDPNSNLWTGWACPEADLTIAPNDLARNRLIQFGLDASRVKTIGMPVKPEFLKPPRHSRAEQLEKLGLDPERITVTITAGSAGGGNMLKIYQALEKTEKDLQVLFITGKNKKLHAKVKQEAAGSRLKTAVIPFTNSMSDAMSACDLLVTKAGGLTTFEAIARRLPMAIDLVSTPMPQEAGTAEMLIEAGIARAIKNPQDILEIVKDLSAPAQKKEMTLPAVHNLDNVDAVYEIASTILDYCKPLAPAEQGS